MEKLLTVRQLEERLQVDRMTIYRMLSSGRLNGVKVGGQWRFREEDISRLVAPGSEVGSEQSTGEPTLPLPLPCLQALQELFSDAAEVAAAVVDGDGQLLTEITNRTAFCDLILGSATGRQRCARTWGALVQGVDSAPRLHRCHAGLLYTRVIMHVEGRPVAAVIAGQMLSNAEGTTVQPEQLAELAEACGIPLPRLEEAYRTIHRLDHARIERMLHLLATLGVAASRIGSERQRLLAKLDRIAQITMEK